MNADALKFADVFVDFIDNNKITNAPSNLEFRYNHIDRTFNDYKNRWKRYLTDKLDELDDKYDDWYDDLEFDKIPYEELSKYHLPLEKFKLEFNYLTYFLEIADYFKNAYNDINSKITDTNKFLLQVDTSKLGLLIDCIILHTQDRDTCRIVKSKMQDVAVNTFVSLRELAKNTKTISFDVNSVMSSNNSYTKIDKNSPEDENEERRRYKAIFDANDIAYFKRLHITADTFKWAKGNSLDYDLPTYLMEKVFVNIPKYHKCNNEELADKLFSII